MPNAVIASIAKKKDFKIIKARKEDIHVLKNVLVKSFMNDPFTNWLVKHDDKILSRMDAIFAPVLNHFGFKYAHVYTTEEKNCCAVWIPPGKYNPNSIFNLLLLPAWIKVVGWSRLLKTMQAASVLSNHHAGPQYFYLSTVGTLPELQGKGIGSAILKPVLDICDGDKIPACLETSNEKNISFYEKHGFKIKSEFIIPHGGARTWVMTREPINS